MSQTEAECRREIYREALHHEYDNWVAFEFSVLSLMLFGRPDTRNVPDAGR